MTEIAAGITLYNPDIDRLKLNVESIIAQVDFLYMIDNNSDNISEIIKLYGENTKIKIIQNQTNLGIAKALNQMCEAAFSDGYIWIITLDQDSVAENEIIKKFSRYTQMDKVAIITPYFEDENETKLLESEAPVPYEQVHRCNTSASLTKLSAWKQVGGFDEKMFIDCVDFDFCTMIEEAGYVILRDNEAILHHMLGEAKEIRAFMPIGRIFNIRQLKQPMYTYNHSVLRTYYYARNIKYYMYKHRNYINLFTERRVFVKWFILKMFFEENKFEKFKAIVRGRKDAAKMIEELKKTEKIPEI